MIVSSLLDNPDEKQRSTFKNLKCILKNKTLLEFKYCRVKVYSRNSSGLAVNITFNQTIKRPVFLKVSLSYKYGQIYRRVVNVPEFELCSAVANFKLLPPFVRAFVEILGDSIKRILEGCPFNEAEDLNLVLKFDDSKWPSIFPTGYYKFDTAWRASETLAFVAWAEVEIISSIKSSF